MQGKEGLQEALGIDEMRELLQTIRDADNAVGFAVDYPDDYGLDERDISALRTLSIALSQTIDHFQKRLPKTTDLTSQR